MAADGSDASQAWVPPVVDTGTPSPARVYDYVLGGTHNFDADRQMAERLRAVDPNTELMARENRAFLRRAVEYLVAEGVRQFLDIGSGIPTVGHVHEIAQTAAPESRVVFVDVDPVAVAHSRHLLAGNDRTAVVEEDVRNPEHILDSPEVRDLLDLNQPVAVLLVALLHYVSDADDPAGIVSRLTGPLAPESYLAISHGTDDGPADMATMRQIGRRAGIDVTWRTRQQVQNLLAGLEVVEPGVVWVSQWRPDTSTGTPSRPELSSNYAGIGRKPRVPQTPPEAPKS
jgi:SAM-dependent methyltransferase